MKKVMMLFAAALLAGFAQAAYVNWGASSLTDYKGGNYYLFDGSKQSDVLAALGAVDSSTATTLAGMALTSGSVSTKGKITANGVDMGSSTTLMAVVFNGDIADGVGYKYIVDDVSSMLFTPPASAPGSVASTLATAGTAGTMSAGSVTPDPPSGTPEPTSGLLLLVGGAMLALRRKQK